MRGCAQVSVVVKLKPADVDMLIEFLKDPEGWVAGKYAEPEKK